MIIKNEIPILEYDTESLEMIRPNHGAENLKLPEKCVFAFLSDTVDQYAKEKHAQIAENFETTTKTFPIYIIDDGNMQFTLAQAPLGASASAQFLDTLIACGCKKIICTGSCGVLNEKDENAFIIPVKALRDEGTSYQYLPASRYIEMNHEMKEGIEKTLQQLQYPFETGITWTTDGFFRETKDMVSYRKEEGCDTVEMEAAALMAVSEKRGAKFGQVLFTADSLANVDAYDQRGWGKASLRIALDICIEVLKNI